MTNKRNGQLTLSDRMAIEVGISWKDSFKKIARLIDLSIGVKRRVAIIFT